jgi:hypothetical protein
MFSGSTFGDWSRMLLDNRFAIDAPFWPRALLVTLGSIPNTFTALAERWRFGQAIERTAIPPPIFVLGAWRSGTTHLHNLLALDRRFAFPNLYQVTYPGTFLLTERGTAWIIDRFIPKQRPQDAVMMGVKQPQEEDFAMCSLGGQANLMAWAFPRNSKFYDRYMTMADLSEAERSRWMTCYLHFVKKLNYKYGRPLVLKSPANTGRIKSLLELFPEARFVHIHRNPYDVFCSNKHTLLTAGPWWQLQRINYECDDAMHARVIEIIKTLYDGYFAQRSLIPAGRLHDIAYEDLERDPIGELRSAYAALHLPDFQQVEKPLVTYLESLAGYKKNIHPELPEELRQQVQQGWKRCFDEWGYAA